MRLSSVVVSLVFVMVYGSVTTSIVGQADGPTVLALLKVGNSFDALSGFFFGLMMVAASVMLLGSRALPRWLAWLGIVTGIGDAIAVVTFGTDGFWPGVAAFGLVGFVGQVVWPPAIGVTLLLRSRTRAS